MDGRLRQAPSRDLYQRLRCIDAGDMGTGFIRLDEETACAAADVE